RLASRPRRTVHGGGLTTRDASSGSIGRSPAGDRGKIERAPPPREPPLASAPRQTPISRPLDLSGLSTGTADASLVASRRTRMKNAFAFAGRFLVRGKRIRRAIRAPEKLVGFFVP